MTLGMFWGREMLGWCFMRFESDGFRLIIYEHYKVKKINGFSSKENLGFYGLKERELLNYFGCGFVFISKSQLNLIP